MALWIEMSPKKYGRLNLQAEGNKRYFFDYVLNPSGSRTLEEATNYNDYPVDREFSSRKAGLC